MVEQGTHNPLVVGSNPTGPTTEDLMSVLRPRPVHRTPHGSAPPQPLWMTVAAVFAVVAFVVFAVALLGARKPSVAAVPARGDQTATMSSVTTQVAQSGTVEVPSVVGMTRSEAEVLLSAAGLTVGVGSDSTSETVPSSAGTPVERQDPAPGELVAASTQVMLFFSVAPDAGNGDEQSSVAASRTWVVCIDPGHQAKGDSSPEPIGPGSKTKKARATGGATGVRTGIPEYELALQISMNLKQQLEERGVRVVMTRTTSDVNVSSSERAQVANKANADVFVRIHCGGSPDPEAAGLSVVYPEANKWTRPLVATSKRAATLIRDATIARTGAVDLGVQEQDDMAGFNWSQVPTVLVECGFLSNPVEDRLLASPHYQDKLASGIAEGVTAYLREVK